MTHPPTSHAAAPGARFDARYLEAALSRIFGGQAHGVTCQALTGDASDRRYFRVSGGQAASVIVMQLAEPAPPCETDFARMQKFLSGQGLRVPALYWDDIENGLLFLEDVGDVTLEEAARRAPEDRRRYYRKAVKLLVALQARATAHVDPGCPANALRFDVEKLMWEFDFMVEHYVVGLCRRALSAADRRELRAAFLPVAEHLAGIAPCLAHRDYHSRNLMVHDGELVMLDFQDARMGPPQYDLASLLRDSYVVLEDHESEELMGHYLALWQAATGKPHDSERFLAGFDEMALQRNLKAVGTFAYQSVAKKNPRYLESIRPTLAYVRRVLAARPGLASVGRVLKCHVPGIDPDNPGPTPC